MGVGWAERDKYYFKKVLTRFIWFAGALGTRFHITKYPTLKYVVNGQLAKREYRGQRSAEKFVEFVSEQTKENVKEYFDLQELNEMDEKKRFLIGYFEQRDSPDYSVFRRVASNLKDDCIFMAGFGDVSAFKIERFWKVF